MFEVYFQAPRRLPDINGIIAFLWSRKCNVDTDGNSAYPKDIQWTDFWCQSRENPQHRFEIELEESGFWIISATEEELANRLGMLFSTYSGATIFQNRNLTNQISLESLKAKSGEFPLEDALQRLANSD